MRIVSRPDFDGIVCAVLLRDALDIQTDIFWIEPHEIQSGTTRILKGDIISNLPFSPKADLWFDHHISNKPDKPFKGAFKVAPSAAGVVYQYFQQKGLIDNRYDELIYHTDIIDAACLDQDQVKHPHKYPYILLSMTIKNHGYGDIAYWNLLVDLLKDTPIEQILKHDEVEKRCLEVINENKEWESHLVRHTNVKHKISITDFRSLEQVPSGNRFLTYSIFPETIASVKIRFNSPEDNHVQLSIGKNIFNRKCRVNIGKLLARYGGGGHDGAGGCTLQPKTADREIQEILQILFDNQPEQD